MLDQPVIVLPEKCRANKIKNIPYSIIERIAANISSGISKNAKKVKKAWRG
jgi:hypothetical protein